MVCGRVWLLLIAASLTQASCSPGRVSETPATDANPEVSGRLLLTGSSTVAPLAAEMAKRFEEQYPGTRIDVQTGGSGKGIVDARTGIANIGMVSRALKEGEQDLVAHRVAADGVAMIVHRDNPIETLSDEQVVAIYRGEIDSWSDVGGSKLPITVVHKAEGRATLEVFLAYFQLENPSIKPDLIVGDNEHGIKSVAASAGAIGYVSIGAAEVSVAEGVPIKLLSCGGVPATTQQVSSGEFPITRPLNFVTASEPEGLAKTFIEFCQSEGVHDLIASQYFVPIRR